MPPCLDAALAPSDHPRASPDEDLLADALSVPQAKAQALLRAVGGLDALARSAPADLAAHLPRHQQRRLQVALELGRRALLPPPIPRMIRCGEDVALWLRNELAYAGQEVFVVVGLDARHRIRLHQVIAIGQVDRVKTTPADVFRPLVRAGLNRAIVAHNHPSGAPDPSPQDEVLTLRLAQVGDLLGIPLLDSLIVGSEGFYSFSDAGRLESPRRPNETCG